MSRACRSTGGFRALTYAATNARPKRGGALLTKPELEGLGAAFNRAWPVLDTPGLNGLLEASPQNRHLLHA